MVDSCNKSNILRALLKEDVIRSGARGAARRRSPGRIDAEAECRLLCLLGDSCANALIGDGVLEMLQRFERVYVRRMALVPDLRTEDRTQRFSCFDSSWMFTLFLSALRDGVESGGRGVGGRGCALQVQQQAGRRKTKENNAMHCNARRKKPWTPGADEQGKGGYGRRDWTRSQQAWGGHRSGSKAWAKK